MPDSTTPGAGSHPGPRPDDPPRDGCQPGPIRPSVLLGLIEVLAEVLIDQTETVVGDADVRRASGTLSEEIRQLLSPGSRRLAVLSAAEVRRIADERRSR